MAGFHPATDTTPEAASPRRTRLGLWLFATYLALYSGFMALNAVAPERMEQTPWAGVNVAILYGMGLIFAAFVLAIMYEALCRRIDRQDREPGGDA